MNNNRFRSSQWAILPLLFCSAAVLAGDGGNDRGNAQPPLTLEGKPNTMHQAQRLGQESDGFLDDSTATSSLNTGYVGGNTQIGIGVDSELKGKATLRQVFTVNEGSAMVGEGYVGFNPKADEDAGEEKLTGAGAKLNYHWVSGEPNNPSHVNKIFGAYDQNETKDKKVTVGYGQENQNMFWSGHVSKGISDSRDVTAGVVEKAYDYGVGGRVGAYIPNAQMRVQGGVDYEWGEDFADNEERPNQITVSGGVEKFFPDSPHSIGADVEVYKKSGGVLSDEDEDPEVRGGISYRYDIASDAGIWQPNQRYRRVRVELPGEEIKRPPKVERKLVKNTMELEADTFFKVNKAKLTPEAKTRLDAIAGQIRASGHEGNIRITGNTCDLGSHTHNQGLSERRAQAVRHYLASKGFNPNELIARGLGENNPKYPNTDAERHKNRRVDIEYVSYQTKYKDEVIEQGGVSRADPKVVWRKELIPEPPLWVRQALLNSADHKQSVDTYRTTAGAGNGNTPDANDDAVTTTSGAPVTISVLSNDTDPNGDALSIVSFNQGTDGAVTQVGNDLVYTPTATFVGTDTFTYTIQDPDGNQSTATVTVTVNSATSPNPTPVNDSVSTTQNTAVTIDVMANDTDPNGDTLSIQGFTQPANGGVTQSGTNLVYTPVTGYTGTDTFSYTVVDPDGNEGTATVTVTVSGPNLPPINAKDDVVETIQETPITIAVLANDDMHAGAAISGFEQGTHGTVTQSGDKLVYTPNQGFAGDDKFMYTVTGADGTTSSATVSVHVETPGGGLNAHPDLYTVDKDSSGNSLGVLDNDKLPDNGQVTVSIIAMPTNGTATVSGNKVIYTPNKGYSGADMLRYKIVDYRGYESENKVDITVADTNSSNLTANNDYLLIALNDVATKTLDVLANDSGEGMEIIAVGTPRYGTATVSPDGKSIRFTLRAGYCTDHTFTYIVRDKYGNEEQATITIDVEPANIDPNGPPKN